MKNAINIKDNNFQVNYDTGNNPPKTTGIPDEITSALSLNKVTNKETEDKYSESAVEESEKQGDQI